MAGLSANDGKENGIIFFNSSDLSVDFQDLTYVMTAGSLSTMPGETPYCYGIDTNKSGLIITSSNNQLCPV